MSRIYKVIGADEKPRYVKANTRALAIQHVYAPVIEGPLSGGEVAELYRTHGLEIVEEVKS